MMKMSEKRIQIGNVVNAELIEMTNRAVALLGNIDSSTIDAFVEHFYAKPGIKDEGIGRKILREHIVQYILADEDLGIGVFGLKPVVEKHEVKNSKSRTSRR